MEDTAYKHWLNQVKIVSARFKIAPEDNLSEVLIMLNFICLIIFISVVSKVKVF